MHPIPNYIPVYHMSSNLLQFAQAMAGQVISISHHQTLLDEKWNNVMEKEMDAFTCRETLELVVHPSKRKVAGAKWVCTIQYHSSGLIQWYKAHLAGKGYTKLTELLPLKLFLRGPGISLTVKRDRLIYLIDMKNVFLYTCQVSYSNDIKGVS